MTLYELNQANYAQLPTMDKAALANSRGYIIDFLDREKSKYYLLLNNDLHYYTLFTFKGGYNPGAMTKEILDIVSELGEVKSIETNSNGALEFWIVTEDGCNMYPLFTYERGVIEID